ncbi:MAG: hypothetical protein WKG07_37390 [Hymenobacter sp.]
MPFPRLYPLGDAALTLELGQTIDPATHRLIRALAKLLDQNPPPGLQRVRARFHDPHCVLRPVGVKPKQ